MNSLYSLTKLYPKELKPLNHIEKQTFKKLKKLLSYQKKKKKEIFTCDAFILLKGKVEE